MNMDSDNNHGDDDFQVYTNKGQENVKRVYIGGLPAESLCEELQEWIQEQFPTIDIVSLEVVKDKNRRSGNSRAPYALLNVGRHANLVISSLHQQVWKGMKLTVQRERRNNNAKTKTKSSNPHHQPKRKPHTKSRNTFQTGWSKPKQPSPSPSHMTTTTTTSSFVPIPVEQATEQIGSVVSQELKQAHENEKDPINTALAATAAATFLASMNAFVDESAVHEETTNNLQAYDGGGGGEDKGDESKEKEKESSSFQIKDMSELLADFGQADPDWKKMQVTSANAVTATANDGDNVSRLAPHGKAPIHVRIVSFGYHYGAPPRPEGWSQSQPLAPIDVCDLFEPVPKYLEWRDGLSGIVKKEIQRVNRDNNNIQSYARSTVAQKIWDSLLEAQRNGYGYASPLEMTFWIGSQNGKHRSVVVCEWAATQLRKWLRTGGQQIHQPVSVGTFHRDIELQRNLSSNKTKNKNDDDF